MATRFRPPHPLFRPNKIALDALLEMQIAPDRNDVGNWHTDPDYNHPFGAKGTEPEQNKLAKKQPEDEKLMVAFALHGQEGETFEQFKGRQSEEQLTSRCSTCNLILQSKLHEHVLSIAEEWKKNGSRAGASLANKIVPKDTPRWEWLALSDAVRNHIGKTEKSSALEPDKIEKDPDKEFDQQYAFMNSLNWVGRNPWYPDPYPWLGMRLYSDGWILSNDLSKEIIAQGSTLDELKQGIAKAQKEYSLGTLHFPPRKGTITVGADKEAEAPLPTQEHDPISEGLNPDEKIFKRSLEDETGATTGLRRRPDYNEPGSYVYKMNEENSKAAALAPAKSSLLKSAASDRCPTCGSTDFGLMPADFETAKCKNGHTWNHGPGKKTSAVNLHETPKILPQRDDMRGHLDEDVKKEISEVIDAPVHEGTKGVHIGDDKTADLGESMRLDEERMDALVQQVKDAKRQAFKSFLDNASMQQEAQDAAMSMGDLWKEVGDEYTNEFWNSHRASLRRPIPEQKCSKCSSDNVLRVISVRGKKASGSNLAECGSCGAFFAI